MLDQARHRPVAPAGTARLCPTGVDSLQAGVAPAFGPAGHHGFVSDGAAGFFLPLPATVSTPSGAHPELGPAAIFPVWRSCLAGPVAWPAQNLLAISVAGLLWQPAAQHSGAAALGLNASAHNPFQIRHIAGPNANVPVAGQNPARPAAPRSRPARPELNQRSACA